MPEQTASSDQQSLKYIRTLPWHAPSEENQLKSVQKDNLSVQVLILLSGEK